MIELGLVTCICYFDLLFFNHIAQINPRKYDSSHTPRVLVFSVNRSNLVLGSFVLLLCFVCSFAVQRKSCIFKIIDCWEWNQKNSEITFILISLHI